MDTKIIVSAILSCTIFIEGLLLVQKNKQWFGYSVVVCSVLFIALTGFLFKYKNEYERKNKETTELIILLLFITLIIVFAITTIALLIVVVPNMMISSKCDDITLITSDEAVTENGQSTVFESEKHTADVVNISAGSDIENIANIQQKLDIQTNNPSTPPSSNSSKSSFATPELYQPPNTNKLTKQDELPNEEELITDTDIEEALQNVSDVKIELPE